MSETPNDAHEAANGARNENGPDQAADNDSGRERYKVAGDKVVEKLKELLHEGNVRHIVIKNDDGKTLIEIPVSIGVAGALLIPVWAGVGAVAAVVTKCTIEIERQEESEE